MISSAYQTLCAQYYHYDKPQGPPEAVRYYLHLAQQAAGPILEPMCGTGNFLIPMLERGYRVTGFDNSAHMLRICQAKCDTKQLKPQLLSGSFENVVLPDAYALAFVPLGSFGLLTTDAQIRHALSVLHQHLQANAVFAFEFETIASVHSNPGVWHGSWVTQPNGAKLVLNTNAHFDPETSIETTLCRYELWEANQITHVEVEAFSRRLFSSSEIFRILEESGFTIRRFGVPYSMDKASEDSPEILVECVRI